MKPKKTKPEISVAEKSILDFASEIDEETSIQFADFRKFQDDLFKLLERCKDLRESRDGWKAKSKHLKEVIKAWKDKLEELKNG